MTECIHVQRDDNGRFEITTFADEQVRAFVPRPLPPMPPLVLTGMQRSIEQAGASLGRLDSESRLLPDPELFIYAYVRREAQLSSQIEGTQSSLTDLFELELDGTAELTGDDALEVSNYVSALEHGLRRIRDGFPISNRLMREMHRLLLHSGRGSKKQPGAFRRSQNWIGGTRPGNAVYVPPPAELIEDCMADLERFIHDQTHGFPAVVRAGLVHAQFESIHPFLDGNGRLGRLLIGFILQNEGLLREPLLYLSLYLKRERQTYYDLLSQLRTRGDWESWLEFFITGVRETADDAVQTARRLAELFATDRARIAGQGRRAGSALRAHEALKRSPLVSIRHVQQQTGVSWPTASAAIELLTDLDIAREITGRKSDRLFAYGEYIDILSEGAEPL